MNKTLLSIIALFATIMVTNSFCMEDAQKKILDARIEGGNEVRNKITTELNLEKKRIEKLNNDNDTRLFNSKKPSLLCYSLAICLPYLSCLSSFGLYTLANAYLPATDKKETIASTLSFLGSMGIYKLCDWFFVSKVKEYKKKLKEHKITQKWHDARINKIDEILKSETLELEAKPKLEEE